MNTIGLAMSICRVNGLRGAEAAAADCVFCLILISTSLSSHIAVESLRKTVNVWSALTNDYMSS